VAHHQHVECYPRAVAVLGARGVGDKNRESSTLPRRRPGWMSGVAAGRPLGVKGVDGADRLPLVSYNKPASLGVSDLIADLNIELVRPMLNSSRWRWRGLVPQSSWEFEGAGVRLESASFEGFSGVLAVCPLPKKPGSPACRPSPPAKQWSATWMGRSAEGCRWWRCLPVAGRAAAQQGGGTPEAKGNGFRSAAADWNGCGCRGLRRLRMWTPPAIASVPGPDDDSWTPSVMWIARLADRAKMRPSQQGAMSA